ncbi:MAG TPA: hypothetical protein VHS97_12425, partial [Isosphaeraceae bacterium]|nr:hypothetical protein [Isosphaeraceae bacterium]
RKWFETERNNAFLERTRIGRFNLRRLTVALAHHPSPLPREREPVTCIGREFAVGASGLAGNRPYFRPVTCIGR